MDVAALLKDDTEDDAFSEVKVCNIKLTTRKVLVLPIEKTLPMYNENYL